MSYGYTKKHYYIHDAIGIKMTYRDLLYYKGIRTKMYHKNKFHENHANPFHTFRKWYLTWSRIRL